MSFAELNKAFAEGQRLDEQDVERLESGLKTDQQSLTVRARLLGYYHSHRGLRMHEYVEHLAWIVDNCPGDEIAVFVVTTRLKDRSNAPDYENLKSHWLSQLSLSSASCQSIMNAANFFLLNGDLESSLSCLPALKRSKPTEAEYLGISALYESLAILKPQTEVSDKETLWLEAIDWCKRAANLEASDKEYLATARLVNQLFAAGRLTESAHVATTLLGLAHKDTRTHGYSIHMANTVLGKLALSRDDVHAATVHLIESARYPDSIVLQAKGPDLTLASALLESGKTEVVLQFLDLCDVFCRNAELKRRLDRWREAIEDGRKPY